MTRRLVRLFAPVAAAVVFHFIVCQGSVSAQDDPQPVELDARTAVHQIGIIRHDQTGIPASDLLPLPEFVYSTTDPATTAAAWLEFSAVYFLPPQVTTAPLEFEVTCTIWPGAIEGAAWYPYAADQPEEEIRWPAIEVGVKADTFDTTSTGWVSARQMDAAAAVKSYKPGPDETSPDDNGTTEGDLFLFYRHAAGTAVPLCIDYEPESQQWIFENCSPWCDVPYPLGKQIQTAWLADSRSGEIVSRSITIDVQQPQTATSATVALPRGSMESIPLQAQLNEALTGRGLRRDDAAAMADIIINIAQEISRPVLIYTVSPEWVDARFGLTITGAAEEPVRVFAVISALPGN